MGEWLVFLWLFDGQASVPYSRVIIKECHLLLFYKIKPKTPMKSINHINIQQGSGREYITDIAYWKTGNTVITQRFIDNSYSTFFFFLL